MSSTLSKITNHQILQFFVVLVGCLFAAYAGNYIAEENYFPIAAAIGGLLLIMFFFGLGSNIYLLIPICWGLSGQISALPLPFSVRQLVIIMASMLFISGLIFKKKSEKASFEMIDLWIWINLMYLVTVFIRNPVGVAALSGSERVGGKPYLDVLLGVMTYIMLSRFRITIANSKNIIWSIMLVSVFITFAGGVALILPSIASKLAPFYSGFSPDAQFGSSTTIGETRLGFLTSLGGNLILYIASTNNPLNIFSFTKLPQLFFYISGFVMILLSGFRNAIINGFLTTVAGGIFRNGFVGLVKMIFITMFLVTVGMLLSYTPIKLPFTFQRALSFLPGNWEEAAAHDAQDSTEWRIKLWETVLTSDKYIHNKILGDGFGFLRSDYEVAVQAMTEGKQAYEGEEDSNQMAFMIDGDFHSGPISSIRFVGLVGLLLFLPLLYQTARYAYILILRATGTPFEIYAYFIGIPCVILPFFFIFIIGDYRGDLVGALFDIGMLKMLDASMEKNRIESQKT